MVKRRPVKVTGIGWDAAHLRALTTPVARALAGGIVLVSLGLIADRLAEVAQGSSRFQVDPACVLEERSPSWLPESIGHEIRVALQAAPPVSLFAPDFGGRLRDAVKSATPWIGTVERVERIFPNRARVDLTLRRPVVAIEHEGHRYLLDGSGRVLHREPRSQPTSFRFPVYPVFGVRAGAPTVGAVSDDREVLAAVRVAEELRALPSAHRDLVRQIEPVALEVRRSIRGSVAAAGEVHIRTASGVLVEWGRARSGALGLADVPVDRKIEHLARIMKVYPRLAGLEEARLNFDVPHYRPIGGALQFLEADGDGS